MITLNTVDSVYQADYYDYQSGQMMLRSSAPLSGKITGLASNTKPLTSYLHNNGIAEPAVFVTSNLITGVLTDIFAWRDNELVNITLDPATGMSDDTFRLNTSISIQDINGDGYPEVPRPTALPTPDAVSSLDFWQVQWQHQQRGAGGPLLPLRRRAERGRQRPEALPLHLQAHRAQPDGPGQRPGAVHPPGGGRRDLRRRVPPGQRLGLRRGPGEPQDPVPFDLNIGTVHTEGSVLH